MIEVPAGGIREPGAIAAQDASGARAATGTHGAKAAPDATAEPARDATQAPPGIQARVVTEVDVPARDAPPGGLLGRWAAFRDGCTRSAERLHWLQCPQEPHGVQVARGAERLRSADARCWPCSTRPRSVRAVSM